MWGYGVDPPSDTTRIPILPYVLYESLRADRYLGPEFVLPGLEGDLESELGVDGCLLGWLGVSDEIAQVAEGGDEGADVVVGEPAAGLAGSLGGLAGECCGALGFDLAGPFGRLRRRGWPGSGRGGRRSRRWQPGCPGLARRARGGGCGLGCF